MPFTQRKIGISQSIVFCLLCTFFLLAAPLSISAQVSPTPQYEEGQLFLQLKSGHPFTQEVQLNQGSTPAWLTQFNLDSPQFGQLTGEKPFRLPALELIWKIETDQPTKIESLIAYLETLPYIVYAERVPKYELFYTPNDVNTNQWHLATIDAADAWDLSRGNGVTIAVVDDAVLLNHQDLASKIWTNTGEIANNNIDDDNNGYIDDVNGYDVADNDNDPNPPSATVSNTNFSHGTHVAGCAASATDNNLGIASLGFNAMVIPVKCKTSASSGGSLQAAYQGVEYAIAAGSDIINMSWGGGAASTTYQLLFDQAYNAGIHCIAAAGNSNTSMPMYPASYNHVISVGATNVSDQRASFSNYGLTIDVMAPGRDIWSCLAGATNSYGFNSGTSMACPITSGVAALMVQRDPSISPDDLEACLESSCDNINSQNPSFIGQLGAGRINAFQALQCLKPVNARFDSDTLVCPGGSITFTDQSYNNVTSWQWSFPGGVPATSTLQNPTVTYATAGTYNVTLIVNNAQGADTLTRTAYVEVAVPTATLNCRSWDLPLGSQFNLPIALTGEAPWTLIISDGTTNDTVSNITSNPFYYLVSPQDSTIYSLIAVDGNGCVGTTSCEDTVNVFSNFQTTCVTLKPGPGTGKDARIWSHPNFSNTNLGNSTAQDANAWTWQGTAGNIRAIVDFDLSFIPPSSVIQSAELTFFKRTQTVFPFGHSQLNGPNDMWLRRVTAPWGENTVTWNNQPATTTLNELYLPPDTNPNMDYVMNVTQLCQDYIDNPSTSFGFMNRLVTESFYRAVTLCSSDHPDSTLWPELTICYSAPVGCAGTGFQKVYRGSATDWGHSVKQTSDGGYIVAGHTTSSGQGTEDIFLMKTDANGSRQWSRTYGATSFDYGNSLGVQQTTDGGYIVSGATRSGNDQDGVLFKTDASGTMLWQKRIGQSGAGDHLRAVEQIDNGGYITVGSVSSYGFGSNDGWVTKWDATGTPVWSHVSGGGFADHMVGVKELPNGKGFIVGGHYRSLQNGPNGNYLARHDTNGVLIWRTHPFLNNSDDGGITNLDLTADGGIITIGLTTYQSLGGSDIRIIKTDSLGTVQWTRCFGGTAGDRGLYVEQTPDLGYLVAGMMPGVGLGGEDLVLIKLDNAGNVIWSNAYGGTGDDDTRWWGDPVQVTADGGAILTGYTTSFGGSQEEIFLVKVDACGDAPCNTTPFTVQTYTQVLINQGISLNQTSGHSTTNLNFTSIAYPLTDTTLCIDSTIGPGFYLPCLTIKDHQKISDTQGNFTAILNNTDQFGMGSAVIGDLNNDGVDEIAIGANLDDDGGTDQGAVYICFMNANGTVASHQKISETQGGFGGNLSPLGAFGKVCSIGDLNNDGVPDIAVGENRSNDGGTRRGAVWILFLNANGTVSSFQKISDTQGNFNAVLNNDDRFGASLENIGDVNNDGVTDLIVGAPFDDDGGQDRGAAYILFMNTNGTVNNWSKISSTTGGLTGPLDNLDDFGVSVGALGDWNNDGVEDVIVGARRDDDGGPDRGALYMLMLNTNGTVSGQYKISSTAGNMTGPLDDGDRFGITVDNIGDLNGDGITDIMAGAYLDDDGGTDRGAVYIFLLDFNGTVIGEYKISDTQGGWTPGLDNDDFFGGWGLSYIGDHDGDGWADIAASAMWDDDGGTNRGAVYIIHLTDSCTPPPPAPNTCGTVADFSATTVCVGDTTWFTDQSTDSLGILNFWKWRFGDGDSLTGPQNPGHVYASGGVYNVTLIVANDQVPTCFDTITLPITVLDTLTAFAWPDDTICVGDSAQLGVDVVCGMPPFTYSWIPAGNLNDPTRMDPKAAPASSTTYTVTVTDALGATASDTMRITVDLSCCVSHANISGDSIVCIDDSLQLMDNSTVQPGATWQWDFGVGATPASFNGQNPPYVSWATPGAYQVRLIVSDLCGMDTTYHNVYVFPLPIPETGNDTSLCMPDSLQLGNYPLSYHTYSWSPTTGLTDPNISNPVAGLTGSITYYLTVTDQIGGCSATDSIVITEILPPTMNDLGNDTTLCGTATLLLDPQIQNATSITWQDNSTNPTFTVTSAGLYWVEVANACDTIRDSITVTIDPLPTVALGNDTTLCPGETLVLSPVTANTTGTFLWQDNSTNSTFTVTQSGQYWVEVTSANCGTVRDTINLNYATAVDVALPNDTVLCSGQSLTIFGGGTGFNQLLWSTNAVGPSITVSTTGWYWADGAGFCGSDRDSIYVEFLPLPTVALGADTTLCPGMSFVITPAVTNAMGYLWHDASTGPTITVTGPGWVWLEVSSANCGTVRDSLFVEGGILPVADLGADTTLCVGETIELDGGQYPGAAYEWQDGATSSVFLATESASYWVEITLPCGADADTVDVWFQPAPQPDLGPDSTICPADSFVLNPGSFASYLWQDGSTAPTYPVASAGLYIVVVADANGCMGSDSTEIWVTPCDNGLYVPSAFTPNGDGLNEFWAPVENGTTVTEYMIFNRWGVLIFLSDSAQKGWYGTYKNQPVQEGVYTFLIKYLDAFGNKNTRSGTITVVR